MNPWQQLLLVWLVAALAQTLGWRWQRTRANAGIVDVVWSFGVGGAAVLAAATGGGALLPRALLALGNVPALIADTFALLARSLRRTKPGRSSPRNSPTVKPHPSLAYKG